jgi:hypothetical protein
MRHVPWITLVVAVVAVVSPLGRDLIYSAFLSGEQLSNNIAQPLAFAALAILLLLGVLEWWMKKMLRKRRVEN